jgi:hypothetical protein
MSSTTTEPTTPLTESGKYYVVKEEIIDGVKVITREKKNARQVYYEKNKEVLVKKKVEWYKNRYATDEEYREKQKAISRENYRKKVEKKKAEEETKKKLTESV